MTTVLNTGISAALLSGSTQIVRIGPGGEYPTCSAALAAIADESPTKQYILLLAPGIYVENVVLRPYFSIVGVGAWGPQDNTIITSASGATVDVEHDSTIYGVTLRTTSAVATDTALRVSPSLPGGNDPFIVMFHTISTAGAKCIHNNQSGRALTMVYGGIDNLAGGIGCHIDGGGALFILGGMGGATIGFKLENGAFLLTGASVGISADGAAGTVVDADASSVILRDTRIDGFNGIKCRNGALAFLGNAFNFGGIAGTPVDTDATSILVLGDGVEIDNVFGGGTMWAGWSVLGAVVRLPSALFGSGTTVGPDQRPTAAGNVVPRGCQFWATDVGAGNGILLVYNGAAWVRVDTGAVVP